MPQAGLESAEDQEIEDSLREIKFGLTRHDVASHTIAMMAIGRQQAMMIKDARSCSGATKLSDRALPECNPIATPPGMN